MGEILRPAIGICALLGALAGCSLLLEHETLPGTGGFGGAGGVGGVGGQGAGGTGQCSMPCGTCMFCSPQTDMCTLNPGGRCDELTDGGCDTEGTCVNGDAEWVRLMGGDGESAAKAIGVLSNGEIALAGDFTGTGEQLTFDQDLLGTVGSTDRDVFVGKLESEGAAVTGVDSGNVQNQLVTALTTLSDESVVLAGFFRGVVFNSNEGSDNEGMVVKLNSGLEVDWSFFASGTGSQVFHDVSSSEADVAATGEFTGIVSLQAPLNQGDMDLNAMLISFKANSAAPPAAEANWGVAFTGPAGSSAIGRAVAVDSNGDWIWVGDYIGAPTLDTTTLPAGGAGSTFVAKISPLQGAVQWVKSLGTVNGQSWVTDVATDGTDIVLVGHYVGSLGVADVPDNANSAADVMGLKLDMDGEVVWAAAFHSPGEARAHAVAIDQVGNVILAGDFEGEVTCGTVGHQCNGTGKDAFVFKLTKDGKRIWSHTAGADNADDTIWDIVIDGNNNILLAGEVSGDLIASGLAGMPNTPAFMGATDLLVARLKP